MVSQVAVNSKKLVCLSSSLSVQQVNVNTLRAHGKDKKRGQSQYRYPEPKDYESLLQRREKLKQRLAEEMRQYELELSMKVCCGDLFSLCFHGLLMRFVGLML
jgi:hypothetical protein